MKQKTVILFTLVILLLGALSFVLFGCPAIVNNTLYKDLSNRDWRVELGNGYCVQSLNSQEIVLIKESQSAPTEIVISSYIKSFCKNGRYIGIISVTSKKDNSVSNYYLIDGQNGSIYGPFTEKEFNDYCQEHVIDTLTQWESTNPTPSSAIYQKEN